MCTSSQRKAYKVLLCTVLFSGKLIAMFGKSRLVALLGLWIILTSLILLPGSNSYSEGSTYPSLGHFLQLAGNFSVELSVTPQAAEPGRPLSLQIRLTNNNAFDVNPELIIRMPGQANIDLLGLPPGTTFNAQTSELRWQPVLIGLGASEEVTIPFYVNVSDVKIPEQIISVLLQTPGYQNEYTAPFWIGVEPSPTISFDPPVVAVGQPVNLLGEVAGPGPVKFLWSLGDGRIIEAETPEVVYSAPGEYQVRLQASNPLGITSASGTISVVPQPIADFTIQDSTPSVNELISFTDQSGGMTPIRYIWDFGDGTVALEQNPRHAYSIPGIYQVHLMIENTFGSSESYASISVGQSPTADVVLNEVIDAAQPLLGQAFHDDSVNVVHWDMGDGHVYEGDEITHVYWAAGEYLVTVNFSNEFGDTKLQKMVRVGPGSYLLFLPVIQKGGDTLAAPEIVQTTDQRLTSETQAVQILQPIEFAGETSQIDQLLAYINEARKLYGLLPVKPFGELYAAAQTHTNDMASAGYTGHQGSDGTSPAYRVQEAGYQGGYGGEATAWGMQYPIEPVQFWLSSPSHRDIILNPESTDIGIGYTENYKSPNVWYWTVEMGSLGIPRVQAAPPPVIEELVQPTPTPPPVIQPLGPPQNSEFILLSESNLIFTWTWTEPLQPDQRFVVYIDSAGRTFRIGTVDFAQDSVQYQLKIPISNVPVSPGLQSWQIRLENTVQEEILEESIPWPIVFQAADEIIDTPTASPEDAGETDQLATPTPSSR